MRDPIAPWAPGRTRGPDTGGTSASPESEPAVDSGWCSSLQRGCVIPSTCSQRPAVLPAKGPSRGAGASEPGLLLGDHLPGDGLSGGDVPGAVRDRADARLAGPMARDPARLPGRWPGMPTSGWGLAVRPP